jgi:hypothetical protein
MYRPNILCISVIQLHHRSVACYTYCTVQHGAFITFYSIKYHLMKMTVNINSSLISYIETFHKRHLAREWTFWEILLWDLCYSGLIHSVEWWYLTDLLGKPIGHGMSVRYKHSTMYNNPEGRRSHLLCGRSLKSCKFCYVDIHYVHPNHSVYYWFLSAIH